MTTKKQLNILLNQVTLTAFGLIGMFHELKDYKVYKEFCSDKQDFCYCKLIEGGCSFKTSFINNIPDNNTIELCKIAKKLNNTFPLPKGRGIQ